MIDAAAVAPRFAELRTRLASLTDADVTVVAVTKAFGSDAVRAALDAGLADIGESYAQECISKLAGATERPRVHFIGRLQRNKVRRLAGIVDVWQSVDRVPLVDELAARVPGAEILVQVDISGEATKSGCPPDAVDALVERAADVGLQVRGLMGIGPIGPPEDARTGFALLRRTVDRLGLVECSMGMSGDIDVAIGEGATMIRVGTGLFGPRPVRSQPA